MPGVVTQHRLHVPGNLAGNIWVGVAQLALADGPGPLAVDQGKELRMGFAVDRIGQQTVLGMVDARINDIGRR